MKRFLSAALIGTFAFLSPFVYAQRGDASVTRGEKIFQSHCASCHGEKGRGDGIVSKFLDPKPRDFSTGRFRIASTQNGVPTDDDLRKTLDRGMPGSWMPAYAHLSEDTKLALIAYVRSLTSEGIRDRFAELQKEEGQDSVHADLAEILRNKTEPGAAIEVPEEPRPTPASLENGKRIFLRNCAACHGPEGRGGNRDRLRNDLGQTIAARDLTKGIFKGSSDASSLFRRLWGGMPGSPMPSFAHLGEKAIWDIVHYVRTLPMPGSEERTLPSRQEITAYKVAKLPDSPQDAGWEKARPIFLALMPVWWQDLRVEGVVARALHDGKELAIHLTWIDTSANDTAYPFPNLSDAAGIEISAGAEPLQGLGDAKDLVNLWYWRANWERDRLGPVAGEIFYPGRGTTPYPWTPPDASGRDVSTPTPSASPGSVRSQAVWLDPGWTVVFRRSLAAPAASDVPLAEKMRASISFVVLDAAEGERREQMSISVWHDLWIRD